MVKKFTIELFNLKDVQVYVQMYAFEGHTFLETSIPKKTSLDELKLSFNWFKIDKIEKI